MVAMENASSKGAGAPSFFARVDRARATLTATQAKIAEALSEGYRQAVFYTLAEAARAVGASQASVVRLARALGYEGFTDMQDAMRDYVADSMRSTVDRFRRIEESAGGSGGWEELVASGERTLRSLPNLVPIEAVSALASSLSTYASISVVGFESTAGLAEHLSYYLSRAGFPAEAVTERSGNLYGTIRRAGKGTLVLCLMVSRYPRTAVEFCRACTRRGSTLAVISDIADHSLAGEAGFQLSVAERRSTGMNLEVHLAMLATAQLLVLKAGLSDKERTRTALSELEAYDEAFRVFCF